jgi:poly(3-hydroxybutyrate) depolymerase
VGGSAVGGSAVGGSAVGGSAVGGSAVGGSAVGGSAVGGSAVGGSAVGGSGDTQTGGAGPGGYPLGNPAVPSVGCGSTPSLSSGTHHLTSAGLDREYILELPDNYDPNKPYRLLFGMHWLGGSADAVQGWSQWWGLDALDTEDTVIWVAPQGYTNESPWRGGDDKDHVFFDELYEALISDLCIDRSRVFSLGFSFGAMFTNALAQTHQNVLRGVVVYSAADYNIYFPENTGEPLAYMGVHGLDDPTCPIESGRSSRDRFVANNGCAVPDPVPEAQHGGSEVIYDFDCPSNSPVRWVTFDGKHTYPPNDAEGVWVYGVTWEFITQF